MFKAKTVFILGAGASWHYGYPTGEELVKLVLDKARVLAKYCSDYSTNGPIATRPRIVSGGTPKIPKDGNVGLQKQWIDVADKCADLIARLKGSDPLVIDFFIDQNRHLEDIAKLCIAWVILEREFISIRYGGNENLRRVPMRNQQLAVPQYGGDNWIRFILHKLTSGCADGDALFNNDVTFITFNYDVSLQIRLFQGLGHLARFANQAERFITKNDRIIHVYGRLRKDPPWNLPDINYEAFGSLSNHSVTIVPAGSQQLYYDVNRLLDHLQESSQGIQIIAPEKAVARDDQVPDHIKKARQELNDAQCVYILGYGFDSSNSSLLKLSEHLNITRSHKAVMFTNYNNSGIVNKNVARLLGMDPNMLLPEGGRLIPDRNSLTEKSVKDVYGALALDFGSPEER